MKFIEHFRNFRLSQISLITKFESEKNYEKFFSDIICFIVIQIAVFDLLPIFYTKRKFEEVMSYFFREFQSTLNVL